MKFNILHSSISPGLPFDIIVQIIDAVGENEDTNLLKELALVSHCFHQICSKHLFATVELHDADPECDVASSKKGFVKLLKIRPDVVKYIRKLTYEVGFAYDGHPRPPQRDDDLLSPILPNFLRTISRINCLKISASIRGWNEINPSLTSAFIHLMQLPTVNHIDLSNIRKFPMSSLIPSVNLLRLDLHNLDPLEEEIVVQSEMMPKIREFHTLHSPRMTTKLLHAKRQDGQPAFNFMDLRRLSISLEDKRNVRYLMQNAKLLDKLHLDVYCRDSVVGLHDILSPSAHTLKVLDLSSLMYFHNPLERVYEELEALAGNNMLEALSFEIVVCANYVGTADTIGSIIQNVEKVLVKPGWSALRQVSFKVPVARCLVLDSARLSEMLQSLFDKYVSQLSKLESVVVNFSSYLVED